MRLFGIMLFTFATTLCFSSVDYYGPRSTEAELSFFARIKVKTSNKTDTLQAIDDQLRFVIGDFQSQTFLNSFHYPGAIGGERSIKVLDTTALETGEYLVNYSFTGKVNFHNLVFASSDVRYVPLRIPLDPYEVITSAMVEGKNECVGEDSTRGSFFYYWDADRDKCPLKDNHELVVRVTGKLEKIANTRNTWPEYDRLYTTPVFKISVFFGYINDINFTAVNPEDEGFKSYQKFKSAMLDNGFKIAIEKVEGPGIDLYTNFEKMIINEMGVEQKLILNVYLSDTTWGSSDPSFLKAYTNALGDSSIVSYDGHSGLGRNLRVSNFPEAKLTSKYQLLYLNGCSSYSYYAQLYFAAKPGGSRNLDIITTGLPTPTTTSSQNMVAFLQPFIDGKFESYQSLLVGMENSNNNETYLSGVIGDEDNKFRP